MLPKIQKIRKIAYDIEVVLHLHSKIKQVSALYTLT